jgi:hypothetical protein
MIGSTVASLPKFARSRRTRASRFSLELFLRITFSVLFEMGLHCLFSVSSAVNYVAPIPYTTGLFPGAKLIGEKTSEAELSQVFPVHGSTAQRPHRLAGVGGFELSDPEKPPLEHGLTVATEGRSARHIHCRMDWTGVQITL